MLFTLELFQREEGASTRLAHAAAMAAAAVRAGLVGVRRAATSRARSPALRRCLALRLSLAECCHLLDYIRRLATVSSRRKIRPR